MNVKSQLKKRTVRVKIVLLLLVAALTSGACIRLYVQDYANRTLVRYHDASFSLKVIRKNMNYYAIRKSLNQVDTTNLGYECHNPSIYWTDENYVCLNLNYPFRGANSYAILSRDLNKAAEKYSGVLAMSQPQTILVQVDSLHTSQTVSKLILYNWENKRSQVIPLRQSFDMYSFCSFGKVKITGNQLIVQVKQDDTDTFIIDSFLLGE